MSIRREPTYLSTDVWRACMLIARSQSDEGHKTTADEVADFILRATIATEYPAIFDHLKKIDKLDTEMIKTLGATPKNDNPNHDK